MVRCRGSLFFKRIFLSSNNKQDQNTAVANTKWPAVHSSMTGWFYWTLLQPLKGWIAEYNMYVNTKILNTKNRKYNGNNMRNVTKIYIIVGL